ncbi:MAG: septal ring lytic transglycosylase RlpA family protein [Coriobacteriales bacterium]|nr:septal ring lytic transglycosylase RlpA family protein [Coriobacteriales bacterium]
MGFNGRIDKGIARTAVAVTLSLLFAATGATLAFADFVPIASTKVLGVGRIQSAPPAVPVASENKFAVASLATEDAPPQTTDLVEPIARSVATVESEAPAPTPTPVASTPAAPAAAPAAEDGEWITTLATNYATPGDGFLNKYTASGALTTTTSMGVAHKNLPLGTQLELYCPRTGLSCVVTVNDRGPYDGRPDTFDFQMGVTSALGNNTGWYTVQYRILP